MANTSVNPSDFLKPRDPATLPARGRRPTALYPDLVNAFLASGEAAMDVDVQRVGAKPVSVHSALVKAIRRMGVGDKVRASKFGDEVVLIRK